MRTCEAGCGTPIEGPPSKRFCTPACRTAAWKVKKGYADRRKPVGASRNGRRAPDLRISYRKALDAMVHYPGAEAKLRALLTDRQRSALDNKEQS